MCQFCSPVLCSFRTAQSLIWSLTVLWTSGWPAHQQRSVSLSRFCTMPARPTGRVKQRVWARQESLAKWAARGVKQVRVLPTRSELVPVTPHMILHPEPCRPDGKAMFLPDKQSSSTASPNSLEVVSHNHGPLYLSMSIFFPLFEKSKHCALTSRPMPNFLNWHYGLTDAKMVTQQLSEV